MEKIAQPVLVVVTVALLWACTCSDTKQFEVSGRVLGAAGQKLYLEQTSVNHVIPLDSVALDRNGRYRLRATQPRWPEFYRLRLHTAIIPLTIDSCEHIIINADAHDFSINYTVENSPGTIQIQKLRNSSRPIARLLSDTVGFDTTALQRQIEEHKAMARNIIVSNPRSAAAFFAVTQAVGGKYYFDVNNRADRKMWAAVATAHRVYMPDCERTQVLEERVLAAMQHGGSVAAQQNGFIEIALPDRVGDIVRLSSLQGKVVLLDFSAYAMEQAPAYILFLRELHSRYAANDFEIYQVSVDENRLLWMEQSRYMPWICVYNGSAVATLRNYNVQSVPTLFLLNRQGDVIERCTTPEQVESAVEKLLKI